MELIFNATYNSATKSTIDNKQKLYMKMAGNYWNVNTVHMYIYHSVYKYTICLKKTKIKIWQWNY